MTQRTRTMIFDVETNGLLHQLDRIHVLNIYEMETRQLHRFRKHDGYYIDRITKERVEVEGGPEDTIAEGVAMLMEADRVVGHNIISFDNRAIAKVFPDFQLKEDAVRDTLVLMRLARPDIGQQDAALRARAYKAGTPKDQILPGWLVGKHSLAAWGYRMGKHKGDYSKDMERAGLDPWASWSPEMEDYCVTDVEVTTALWAAVDKLHMDERSIALEQSIHDLLCVMERNGYPFDREGAQALVGNLRAELQELTDATIRKYGYWFAPEKKYQVAMLWDDPAGYNRAKTYQKPRPEFGEDDSRAIWAEVTVPKVNRTVRGVCEGSGAFTATVTAGNPYCKIQKKVFNPGSRQHIIDRFTTLHGWTPTEFTDKGNPEVNDAVLQGLNEFIPESKPLAEVFFLSKLIGQIADGKKSWINAYQEDTGCIHPYVNSNGAVSGRCAHSDPNVGQVPGVVVEDVKRKDGSLNPKVLDANGQPLPECFNADGSLRKKAVLLGRKGEYGVECRKLWYTPEVIDGVEWQQVGVDLSGIELRMLGEECLPFHGGNEMLEAILNGDPHSLTMERTGIPNRDTCKRLLYALMYGAGDEKLGITAEPVGSRSHHLRLGAQLRAAMMAGLPALAKAIEKAQGEAARGYLVGLDGRKLHSRSKHSALNLRLQSNAAMIAKKWAVLTEQYMLENGFNHGWDGDFAMVAFIHDELQAGVKKMFAQLYGELCVKAAADAGKFFNIKCPIDAVPKIGRNWFETH